MQFILTCFINLNLFQKLSLTFKKHCMTLIDLLHNYFLKSYIINLHEKINSRVLDYLIIL